jgi:uncharacterized protein YqgV (UPF0045/DUF77 family)
MAVTVKDILCIDLFKDSKVIAGNSGLNNNVKRINFTDCPFPENILEHGLVDKGDLFINSLYIAMEDEKKLLEFFKYFVICESAGTFVISEYVKNLPKSIIDFCNENRFPTVLVAPEIPYATIIKETTEMILADQLNIINEMKIDMLLDKYVSREDIVKTARFFNKSFKKYYASVYLAFKEDNKKIKFLYHSLKTNQHFNLIHYNNGLLIILNVEKNYSIETIISYIQTLIKNYSSKYNIGVSNTFMEIENFNICIDQSLSAFNIASAINENCIYYNKLSIYKLLYPIKDTNYLRDFYNDVMKPLIDYDKSYNSDLIKTLEFYLKNDGDYKKTASDLNQHENTIRYRISKAKKIIDIEHNLDFIEKISIGLKIKNILNL